MKRFIVALLLVVMAGFSPQPIAHAQDGVRTERVRFPAGASGTTLRGRITGYESVSYLIDARAGQRMTVSLNSANNAVYFNVYEPGRGPGDQALATGDTTGPMMPDINSFDGRLPRAGVYTSSVYLYRNAARRGERANFSLDIGIRGGGAAARPPSSGGGDFADGNAGGPDFWQVTGIGGNDRLNIRTRPITRAEIVERAANGDVLRNLGCQTVSGMRWSEVETVSGRRVRGWAAGRYLRESNYSGDATQLPERPGVRPPQASDFENNLEQGPDFWQISGLRGGDLLNIRTGPSTADEVIRRLPEGSVVRNLGCRNVSGQRWCKVEATVRPRTVGWASARFLRETGSPGGGRPAQLPDYPSVDALVPGTNYNATGTLPCSVEGRARDCAFGVIRRGRGDATVVVAIGRGRERRIEFLSGRPVSSDSPAGVYGEWSGDGVDVFIGTREQYRVENAVVFGG
ncbi:MAG TPA: SH3 domain-containing protein [Rhizobiaceae bacterium]|nr:SH3 domain-containing protein [Rhizobiaceae bacterium]